MLGALSCHNLEKQATHMAQAMETVGLCHCLNKGQLNALTGNDDYRADWRLNVLIYFYQRGLKISVSRETLQEE